MGSQVLQPTMLTMFQIDPLDQLALANRTGRQDLIQAHCRRRMVREMLRIMVECQAIAI